MVLDLTKNILKWVESYVILSVVKNHLDVMLEWLLERNTVRIICGGMKPFDLRRSQKDVILGTTYMAAEGMDISIKYNYSSSNQY